MAVSRVFRPNPAAAEQIRRSPRLAATLLSRAQAGAAAARSIAMSETYRTGTYHDSIGSESGVDASGAWARIQATAFYAGFIERGTIRTPPKNIIQRGAETAGLDTSGGR